MNRCLRAVAVVLAFAAASLQAQTPAGPAATRQSDFDQNPFQKFQAFSASMSGGISNDRDRKIYRSGKMMRLDFDNHFRLVDLDKLTTRVVRPDRCSEFVKPDAASYPFSAYHDFNVDLVPTQETEVLDGHSCKIENVTFTPKDGRPLSIKMKLWEAQDLQGFPIKIEVHASNGNTFTVNYTDVSLKAPAAALFKLPASCSRMPAPPPPAPKSGPPKEPEKPAAKPQ